MKTQQRSVTEIQSALEELTTELQQAIARDMEPEKLSFEQTVILAARSIENGDPLKDFMGHDDIDEAIKRLADIYVITGVIMPSNYD